MEAEVKRLRRRIKTLQHRIKKVPPGRTFNSLLEERIQELAAAEKELEEMEKKKKIVLKTYHKEMIMKHCILPERKREEAAKKKN